jgi:hypothetical protein
VVVRKPGEGIGAKVWRTARRLIVLTLLAVVALFAAGLLFLAYRNYRITVVSCPFGTTKVERTIPGAMEAYCVLGDSADESALKEGPYKSWTMTWGGVDGPVEQGQFSVGFREGRWILYHHRLSLQFRDSSEPDSSEEEGYRKNLQVHDALCGEVLPWWRTRCRFSRGR